MFQNAQIGQIIQERRKTLGMTQTELAGQLGISPQAVSKWENGMGSPDISLLPEIGNILHLSMDQLFGLASVEFDDAPSYGDGGAAKAADHAEEATHDEQDEHDGNATSFAESASAFPETYHGLTFVASFRNRACYSNVPLSHRDGEHLYFENGSEADLSENVVVNHDRSRIEIVFLEEIRREAAKEAKEASNLGNAEEISRLNLELHGSCKVQIRKTTASQFSWRAEGSQSFLRSIQATQENHCLRLTIDPKENAHSLRIFNIPIFGKDNNTITIDCPSDTLEELRLRTAGSSDVDALVSFQRASIRTAGSSDVNLARVENLELNMAGSGDVDVETCSGASIRMAGSADACIHQIYGVLHVDLSGSGDFKVDQGEVSEFRCSLRGSGDVDARGLVVDDSEVVIRGSGDVVIGRVKGKSVEQLSMSSTLEILQRG